MRGLTALEVELLEDACLVLTDEERNLPDPDGEADFYDWEQPVADRLKARGCVVVDDDNFLEITPRGRVALMCHYAASLSGRSTHE